MGSEIALLAFSEIAPEPMVALMNHPQVLKYLPLATSAFTHRDYEAFIEAKQQLWRDYGYGPHVIMIDGAFAGWGGLQHENGDADFALVLHPDFWGYGLKIFKVIKHQAFHELHLHAMTILLPPSRLNMKAVERFGFVADGQRTIDGKTFRRFRLTND